MTQSLFQEYVDKFFTNLVGRITETINGKKQEEQYLYKQMLTEEFSADLKWDAAVLKSSIVAADVVALDSPLPLKKRDSFSHAGGTIPKMGMKFRKGEKDITDINITINSGATLATIVNKIFDDTPKCIKGIDVRTEMMFEQGLSTGETIVGDNEDNTGTGIRVDYGYLDENKFSATTAVWSSASATPMDDIQQMFDKASDDGVTITDIWMSKQYFNYMRNTTQGKQAAANYRGIVFDSSTILPVPTPDVMILTLQDEFGATVHVINTSYRYEKPDGTQVSVKPWEQAHIIGTTDNIVGRLVYGKLAEETNPVNNVTYTKSGASILVSKYSKTDPLEEFTTSQSLRIPVIDNGNYVYLLNADNIGGVNVEYTELTFMPQSGTTSVKYTSNSDITATSNATSWLGATVDKDGAGTDGYIRITTSANATGSERTGTITVSDADGNTKTISVTQRAVMTVSAASDWTPAAGTTLAKLTFSKAADTTGKTVTVTNGQAPVTVSNAVTWSTVTIADSTITVKVEANTGAARTGKVTVRDAEGQIVSFNVYQEANA